MSVLQDLKALESSIVSRYRELQPVLQELAELRQAADRLGIDLEQGGRAAPKRRRASKRRDQVLELVRERPGITVPEIGQALNVDPTGLYRVVRQLESDGVVTKRAKELHPAS